MQDRTRTNGRDEQRMERPRGRSHRWASSVLDHEPISRRMVQSREGGLYGAAAEIARNVTAAAGLPFGAAFWLVVDEGAVPLLGLSEGPMAYPLSTQAYALSSHFVYGLTAEMVRRAVRGAL